MFFYKIIFCLSCLLSPIFSMDNLRVAFEWKKIDFNYPTPMAKEDAISKGEFIPENNIPLGLEVYKDRVFITVPRWKTGVPSSLNYISLSADKDSPKLQPYPSWEAHQNLLNNTPEIVSPFRIRADKCERLWVLDTGTSDLLGDTKILSPSKLLIYDLHNDALLRSFIVPAEQLRQDSFLANIAVEDTTCDDTFAYLGDLGKPGLIVYSWKANKSWRVQHNFFHIDPLAGEFNVAGIPFEWNDGVFGLALSSPDSTGYSTLFFHPLTSTNEFSVSTRVLRDPALAKNSYHNFSVLGSRGPKGQSSVSFLDQKTNVLFYALVNLNAIACWRTTNPAYTMQSQGRVFMSNVSMVFPNDIKVDAQDNLWVLSDKLPIFMYSKLNYDEVNFRILTASVPDAIRGTACDSKLVIPPKMMERLKPGLVNNTNVKNNVNSAAGVGVNLGMIVVLGLAAIRNYV